MDLIHYSYWHYSYNGFTGYLGFFDTNHQKLKLLDSLLVHILILSHASCVILETSVSVSQQLFDGLSFKFNV